MDHLEGERGAVERSGGFQPAVVGDDPPLPGLDSAELPGALAAALERELEGQIEPSRPRFTNRLILESSPYLLQHAHNPVNWYPWGDEAFARARAEGKLVFLSVGYSTCHWCHVMERESFEDDAIAGFINQHYVAIKVDREERPDVDSVYMTAVHLLSGGGGWPMTVILTPDREPIFAGTYFPPRDGMRGVPGLPTLLARLLELYGDDPDDVKRRAAEISRGLRSAMRSRAAGPVPGLEVIDATVEDLARGFDSQWGGFGSAPKFPRPATLDLLARHARRHADPRVVAMVTTTLERMANGGMRDHVGGGFHRYSVDRRWLVPHFEKMLYDNAQLVIAYLQGYQLTGREDFAEVARDTADYMITELAAEGGGFYSATDADSADSAGQMHEGRLFTWTAAELEEVLDRELLTLVNARFGLGGREMLDGREVIFARRSVAEVATMVELEPEVVRERLGQARAILAAERGQRPLPLLDDKLITAWNGLAISALARLGFAFADERYVNAALGAAEFVIARMARDGRLLRTYRNQVARHPACLDDYAFLIAGLLDLYEATLDTRWISRARGFQRVVDEEFAADEGGYYFTSELSEKLLVRDKPYYDGAEPSGNSVSLLNLLRLEQLTGVEDYRQRAERLLAAFASQLAEQGEAMPMMLAGLDAFWDDSPQIVLAHENGDDIGGLLAEIRRVYLPDRALAVVSMDGLGDKSPPWFAAGREPVAGLPTAHVCRRDGCRLPTSDPATLATQLREVVSLLDGDDD